jgi:ABC-type spermidine/putrescine transport system permease subunit II
MVLKPASPNAGRARVPGRHPRLGRFLLYGWCALVFAFLMAPLLIVFPISFSSSSYLQFPPPGWSLRWYEAYFTDPAWIDSTLRSLKIGFWVTVAATLIGTPLTFSLIRGRYPGRALLEQITNTPLVVPSIVFAVAVYGAFAKAQLIGDWRGIVLAHTVHAIPYVVVVVGSALKTVDLSLEQAAMGLGASRFGAVWRVTLPQIRPALVSAMFLAFISSFDELVVAMFLGGSNMTLPKKMFDNILNAVDPTIAAVSVLQIVIVSAALLLAQRFGAGVRPAG